MYTRRRTLDWIATTLYLSLIVIGWLMLYSASDKELQGQGFHWGSTIGRQSIWIGISLMAFVATLMINWKYWYRTAYIFYGLTLLLLILVLFFGVDIKGARSWIRIFGLTLQPGEFAKMTTCLALSSYLSYFNTDLRKYSSQAIAAGILLLPALLIALQPDWGSALVFSSFLIVFYRAGLPNVYYIIAVSLGAGFVLGLLLPFHVIFYICSFIVTLWTLFALGVKGIQWSVPFALTVLLLLTFPSAGPTMTWEIGGLLMLYSSILNWHSQAYRYLVVLPGLVLLILGISYLSEYSFTHLLKPHQQDRINVWLHPDKTDPHGPLYNVLQSKVAIGSGGLRGKGFNQGHMTGLNFVPEQTTDFIFSTIGEEQGFIGSVAVVLLFVMLILRILQMGEHSGHPFILYYAYGFAGLLFFHFFVNIGMTMGLVPIIGIPLPFISKGGSAILVFSVMMAIMLKMDNPAR